ncbi:MAG TPA: TMEM175 family protein, partial [Acidimicrobiales bacterium]|nr:TMEM175 family protein [Acidimicrobiales bacterium]
METARIEAFSDGVFAIAITLLILDVRVPAGTSPLSHRLLHNWPSYLAYLISFLIIGIMWANHHGIFELIGRTSHGLIVANLMLLMCVAFIPFPTSVLADNLRSGTADQRTAAVFYNATFTLTAVAYNLLWRTASRGNRLIIPGREAEAAEVTRRFRYGVPGYLAVTLVGLVSLPASLAIDGALAAL